MTTLDGTLERVVFRNPDTMWTVARLAPVGGGVPVTVVGALLGVPEGTPLRLHGEWVDDPRYGRQFKVDSYQTRTPETRAGIERFLGSGLIPGIGPELARRIVDRFGLETLEIIDRNVQRLGEVEGIGPSRLAGIADAWVQQRKLQDVMVFLQGLGVSAAFARRIHERWGTDAVAIIRKNPYRLVDIWGIGFRTADGIARRLGIAADAPERLEAGLVHALGELAEDGHTYAPADHLLAAAAELLGAGAEGLAGALDRLVLAQQMVREPLGDRGLCVSLAALWQEETQAAIALAALAATPPRQLRIDADAAIAEFEMTAGIELAAAQRRAVVAAVRDKCVVITGGPGVGKTTIVRAIVRIFTAGKRKVALAAPTGRAAKRLGEATGAEASTIHRLLEFQPQTGTFLRGAADPLEV
ncbi:MAG TPA: helix-hairpin-helix domain-containing protein, partial [Kofleriaceae bacterium]|nr:helix-hairpin-helix domain-containing protein [Kofleriaceae bacterium]